MDRDEYNRYLSGLTPAEAAQHFKNILADLGDLDVEEVLLQQESAFSYIEESKQHGNGFDYGEPSNRRVFYEHEGESSYGAGMESQLALDEALARALMEDDFNDLSISEPRSATPIGSTRSNLTEAPPTGQGHNARQDDDIDPDKMSYEVDRVVVQLQELGDAIGHESRGLAKEIISRLPTSKYRVGLFSKKEKQECVICCDQYKNGVKLTTLPCAHHYHSDCITEWLKLNKHCPVCQKEVQDT